MMQILIKIKVIFLSKTRNSGFKLWERAIERYFINVSLCDELEPDGKVLGFLLPGYQLRGLNVSLASEVFSLLSHIEL